MKYIAPTYKKEEFHCPLCGVYAHQEWGDLIETATKSSPNTLDEFECAFCSHCKGFSLWQTGHMIYPDFMTIAKPNDDLNNDIKKDYLEAASVIEKSPRAAAALLRLAIQKLCKQLGETGEALNEDIGSLVKKGLSKKIQQALDIVRVSGNESVHPGQMNLDDDKKIALKLFELVNIIAQTMITEPKEINKLFSSLPKSKLEGIKNRDASN